MYIFRPPADASTVKLDYAGCRAFLEKGRTAGIRRIGTTLTVIDPFIPADDGVQYKKVRFVEVWLYNTCLAEVRIDGSVHVSRHVNQHGSQATTWWLQKLLTDNGFQQHVARENGRYSIAGKTIQNEVAA